jgi:predicted DNA-binding ribbon-helix-helix protein
MRKYAPGASKGTWTVAPPSVTLAGMPTVSVKLPESLLRRIERAAVARRLTKSSLIRETLEQALTQSRDESPVSCYDLAKDLAGSMKGLPRDLATNPKYLEGLGQ